MLKKTIMMELSKKSIEETIKKLEEFNEELKSGTNNAIKLATEAAYQTVITNCYKNRLGEFVGSIHWDYDSTTNVGKVYTDDMVIVFNEFGTGASSNGEYDYDYASKHGYKINLSGRGEQGWAFPTKTGEYKWTHGIPSRKMFYNAYEDIKKEIGEYIEVSLKGKIGKMY